MKIIPIEEIRTMLLVENSIKHNFPKTVNYKFDTLYSEIVTQIKTIEISSECILFNSVEAHNTTKEFSDKIYWTENITSAEIENFWFFGQNGQGDFWLFDKNNRILFYDHNQEELNPINFINLGINFQQWLQFSFLNKQLDEIYDTIGELDNQTKIEFKKQLHSIDENLLENYPFEI
ncbi:hypothetical protein [Epilithonimonas caeni]|uniref:hypothetical protein n=1 Tax=Epilithonimonas caeni TaxID=365343 RepID=UPI0004200DAC|nr:hypothetical protein [Epilithonimonas caeni]